MSASWSSSALAQVSVTYSRIDGHTVEANIYPAFGPRCAPLAIVSHGLGGTKDKNAQLAAALNQAGFRVVVPSHAESGPRQLFRSLRGGKAAIEAAASSPESHRYRSADFTAILAVEEKRCRLPYKLLAGHSMGARATLLEAGAKTSTGIVGRDRFDIYIAISAEGVESPFFPAADSMSQISKPTMVITGTKDDSLDGPYQTRLSTYKALPSEIKRLAIIDDATHMDLGGRSDDVGKLVGTLSAEFSKQVIPGPWAPAVRHRGVLVTDTAR